MSLDNVLLVASIARDNPALLFIGLSFSVLFMGFAANYVARLIERYSGSIMSGWPSFCGLLAPWFMKAGSAASMCWA